MQSPEQVPILAVSVVITIVGMGVIFRSWWRTRSLPALLYGLMISCFSGMALDLLLDQVYMPFRGWEFVINDKQLWMSNILLAIFIVSGYLAWYFAITFSMYETPPRRSLIVVFLAGAALIGEFMKEDWSRPIPLGIEVLAFSILILEIVLYARRVLGLSYQKQERGRTLIMYFLGFLIWIIAGPIGIIADSIPNAPDWFATVWVFPYTIGLLMVAYTVALNPTLLFVSEILPLDYLILDQEGVLVFTHRFSDYEGSVDAELMGSAISGVLTLIKEMLPAGKAIHGVDHGDVKILVEHGQMTTHLLIASRETPSLRQTLRNMVLEFEANYRESLTGEPGLVTSYEKFSDRVQEVFL